MSAEVGDTILSGPVDFSDEASGVRADPLLLIHSD